MASINNRVLFWATISALAALCFGVWFTWRAIDTSGFACDPKRPIDAMRAALWNPFRDHTPEAVATFVMKARVSGDCRAISRAQTYCSAKEPIGAWHITGESKVGKRAWVRVSVDAQKHDGSYGDNALYVTMERQDKVWRVLSTDWSDACGY